MTMPLMASTAMKSSFCKSIQMLSWSWSAKTLMMVQVSPVIKNVGESLCSLTFAERVKKVELGSAKKVSESAEVAQLKKRIRELEGAK